MSATVIVGLQYGDEGKGKIIDRAAVDFDVVIRYNGGANAGHTVENALGTFNLHLVPSGIFNARALCILGNGAVVDPDVLIKELNELAAAGVDTSNFRLSSRAHLVMPWHKAADKAAEAAKGSAAIGTTGRGIGPCYGDKVARVGVRAGELCDRDTLVAKLTCNMRDDAPSADEVRRWARWLGPMVDDTDVLAREALASGKRVLLEAAQGTMIDLEYGTYPYVTSSYATSAGACIGSGLPPTAIGKVVGVAKAYTTRVGNGPFATELLDETGERLRQAGHEFGTTTGRPRRCGWFDAPLARYASEVNGASEIVLTKLDVLSSFPVLSICVGYVHDGKLLSRPPGPAIPYELCKPVYADLPGWSSPIAGVTRWEDLPAEARAYVEFLEDEVGVRIAAVATGPHRDAIIER